MLLLLLAACNGGGAVETTRHGDDSEGAPVASFSSDALVWTDLSPGFSANQTLDVTNVGTAPLEVTDAAVVTDPSDVFTVDFTAFTLEPGDIGSIVVAALLVEDAPATGELRVRTNDPAAATTIFPLTVN